MAQLEHPLLAELARRGALGVVGGLPLQEFLEDLRGDQLVHQTALRQNLEALSVLELRPRVLEVAHDARADAHLLIGGAPLVRGRLIVERDLLEDQVGLGRVVVLHEGATLK